MNDEQPEIQPSYSAADTVMRVMLDPQGFPIGKFHGVDDAEVVGKFDASFGKGAAIARMERGYRIVPVRFCPMSSARARELMTDLDFLATQGLPAAESSYERLRAFLAGEEHLFRIKYTRKPENKCPKN